jgi:outer membrane protein assembly factor BamB
MNWLTPPPPPALVRSWRWTARIAAVWLALVALAMGVAHLQHKSSDPWRSPALLALKERLRAEPKNEDLKRQIRELDLRLRERYFRLLALKNSGVWLLLGGAAVLVIAGGQVRRLTRQPPLPQADPNAAARAAAQVRASRRAVIACGAVVAATFLAIGLTISTPPLRDAIAASNADGHLESAVADCASEEELRVAWPVFRGFTGGGVAPFTNAPARWDAAAALWRTPLDAPGFSSPIVFGGRVFLSSGDATRREVLCFDLLTGALRWRRELGAIPGRPAELPEVPDMTSHAPNTPATDGRRVYALFATGEIAAFALDGERLWARHLGVPRNPYGHASSLAVWRDRVIVQFDQGEPEDRLSKLFTLDGRTGATVWERPRPVGASWASPIVIEVAGASQIVSLAQPWIIANDGAHGAELWRVAALEGEVTPSPVFAGGLVIAVSPSARLLAIRPDGRGDVTKTHVAWSIEEFLPDISSPVSDGERIYTITSGGLLACFDLRDGKKIWEHDFEAEFHASPCVIGNLILLAGLKGDVIGAAAAGEFREVFRVKLDDTFQASPALAERKVILRGAKYLWAFGAEP